MIKHKEIKLLPTLFSLDVYIVGEKYKHNRISEKDRKVIASIFVQKYGHGYEYWHEQTNSVNEVFQVTGATKSEHGNTKRIVMVINPHIPTLVHEIIHVLWYLSKYSGLDMDFNSQEWQACMAEYIFTESKNFKKIPIFEMK